MAVLGKRKTRAEPAVSEEDAAAIFRRHFEMQFSPLPGSNTAKAKSTNEDADSDEDEEEDDDEDDEGEDEGEWGGLSEDEDSDEDEGRSRALNYQKKSLTPMKRLQLLKL